MSPCAAGGEIGRGIVPALGHPCLTRCYDPVVALTTREETFKRLLIERAGLAPGQVILDLGCGTGTLALAIKRAVPAAQVTGLDGDPEVLRYAHKGPTESPREARALATWTWAG